MALRTLVKISSVNNLSDARYAAGMGVELMGFDLEETSYNYVAPEDFAAITNWVSGVKFVGEIQITDQEKLSKMLKEYPLDYLQVNNPTSASSIQQWPLPLIVKIDRPDRAYIAEVLEQFATKTTWFLLELEGPLNADLMEWCAQQSGEYQIIMGSLVTAKNVLDLLDSGYCGVALAGGNNFNELADMLEALEVEN